MTLCHYTTRLRGLETVLVAVREAVLLIRPPGGSNRMHDGDYSGTPGFAAAYLETFYAQEPTRLDWLDTEFLVRRYARMGPVSSFLELGCGPTVFHVIPVTPYTERIYM